MKMKESDIIDKYFDLARELKKLQSMKVTVIISGVVLLGTIKKCLQTRVAESEIREKIKTIQIKALLKSARKIIEAPGDLRGFRVTQISVKDSSNRSAADHGIKLKECEKTDKYLDLARELKKTMEHAGDNYTNYNWCVWNNN